MSNQLENFIKDNREEFDSADMKIDWEKIRRGMTQKKTKGTRWLWWAAAASIALFITAVIYFDNRDRNPAETAIQPVDLPSKELTDQVDPDYTIQMDHFASLIKMKQNELQKTRKSQPDLYRQFLQDNNRIDSSYNYLKSKLTANPNKEILLDAMIQNLQLKIDILNRQLQIIKESKPAYRSGRHKKSDNENKTI